MVTERLAMGLMQAVRSRLIHVKGNLVLSGADNRTVTTCLQVACAPVRPLLFTLEFHSQAIREAI